jgi:hypothetical protein
LTAAALGGAAGGGALLAGAATLAAGATGAAGDASDAAALGSLAAGAALAPFFTADEGSGVAPGASSLTWFRHSRPSATNPPMLSEATMTARRNERAPSVGEASQSVRVLFSLCAAGAGVMTCTFTASVG